LGLLTWPGSKWNLCQRLINILPEHRIYLEPFLGSGAVFFNKTPCNTEILNDLDGDIVNLFTCIRDYPEELSALIELTPYSREEYKKAYDRESCTALERARRFIIRCNMARAGMQYYSSSWRHSGPVLGATCKQRVVGPWNKLPGEIFEVSKRLKDAEIEQTDAVELIKKYNRQDCLVYADPPYLLSTRKQRYYNVEMETEQAHEGLLRVLIDHSGPVVLSGYNSDLYNDMLKGWERYEFVAQAEQGRERKEIVWVNRADSQLSLFG
jgi:DNA adenine methylase